MSIRRKINKLSDRISGVIRHFSGARLPLMFIHIPKTAGTSFRFGSLESKLISNVLCDYGEKSVTTSKEIRQARYDKENKIEIKSVLDSDPYHLLIGHFPVHRYMEFYYPYQIATFLRRPAERTVSNFYHKKRVDGYELSIEEYIETNSAKNLQSSYLSNLPLEYIGFIGLSEEYEKSIAYMNRLYGVRLEKLKENVNPQKDSKIYETEEALRKRLLELNNLDQEMYAKAQRLLKERVKAGNFENPLYGAWTLIDNKKIKGRAYRAFCNEPAVLTIEVNGEIQVEVTAGDFDPIPCNVKQPRDGQIGFEYELGVPVLDESQIKVGSRMTNEYIFPTYE